MRCKEIEGGMGFEAGRRTCVCGSSCVACTMYTTELLTSVERGAARARTQSVAQLAPGQGQGDG